MGFFLPRFEVFHIKILKNRNRIHSRKTFLYYQVQHSAYENTLCAVSACLEDEADFWRRFTEVEVIL